MLFNRLSWINLLGSATNGNDTLAMITQHHPDIALIDLSMPGTTIDDIIKTVESRGLNTQLIALTMLKDSHRAQQLLTLGLSGYVVKDTAFEDLLDAIKYVKAGGNFISPSLVAEMQGANLTVVIPYLTEREIEVLTCAAKGDGNKQIAYHLGISQRTVCFHMTNCFMKLNASNRANAIAQALNYGLVTID